MTDNKLANIDLEDLSSSVLTELNRIRADPTSYVAILNQYLGYFKDNNNILYRPGNIPIETYEGPEIYIEAQRFLKKQRPVGTLTYDNRVAKASQGHADDLGPLGLFSHDSKDGKNAAERIDKYCEWEVACCENVDLGGRNGIEVIVSLLVDDGLEKKIHREHLFREELTHVGIGSALHKDFDTIVVIDCVGGVRESGKPFYERATYKYEYPKDLTMGFQNVKDKDDKKQLKIKSSYQLQDTDAPDGTTSMKITKQCRLFEGKKNKVTKKYYSLENGTHHVVEVEEI
jgi:hypothetical protein